MFGQRLLLQGYGTELQSTVVLRKIMAATAVQKCAIPDGGEKGCGFSTITAAACHSRGCCFQPTKMNGAPWCFSSHAMASTSTATTSTTATAATPSTTATPSVRDGNNTVPSHNSSQTTSISVQVNTSSTTTTHPNTSSTTAIHPNMEPMVANDAIHPYQTTRHADKLAAQDSENNTIILHATTPSHQPHSGSSVQVACMAIVGWALTSSTVYMLVMRCLPGQVQEAKLDETGEQHEEQPLTSQSPTGAHQSSAGTTIAPLDPTDQLYEEIQSHFESTCDTNIWPAAIYPYPSPAIANIFQLSCGLHRSKYIIKQQELVAKG